MASRAVRIVEVVAAAAFIVPVADRRIVVGVAIGNAAAAVAVGNVPRIVVVAVRKISNRRIGIVHVHVTNVADLEIAKIGNGRRIIEAAVKIG